MSKVLVTGALGQIGSELVPALQKKFGRDNVITFDMREAPSGFSDFSYTGTIEEKESLREIIKKHQIDTVYHLVSLLSARGEQDPALTWRINMGGLLNILNLAVEFKLKIFWPSSIAAFGPTTPRDHTPQHTILEPTTMYGVSKTAGENLCHYYFLKYDVDVRSLRYPGVISWKTEPGGGTTDYAVDIFYQAVQNKKYVCFVNKETTLPMMYMDDAVRATLELMEAPKEKITIRTAYNLAAISFSAEELAKEVNRHLPIQVEYQPDQRQKIADSWPRSIDDSQARIDWGWQHEFDLPKMTEEMLAKLKIKFSL